MLFTTRPKGTLTEPGGLVKKIVQSAQKGMGKTLNRDLTESCPWGKTFKTFTGRIWQRRE
jgi:hypothetical protein